MIRLDLPNCPLHKSSKSDMEVPTVQDTLQFKAQTKSPPSKQNLPYANKTYDHYWCICDIFLN